MSGADVGPRRRRRRGGRGRRTGLGGVGDANTQSEALQDAHDAAHGDSVQVAAEHDDRGVTDTPLTGPDDLDTAILQLLASRDREESTAPAAEERPAETTAPPAFQAPSPPTDETPAQPRRAARTSFSTFGPPDIPIRPIVHAPTPDEPGTSPTPDTDIPSTDQVEDATTSTEPYASPVPHAEPDTASVTQGLAPDAVVSEPAQVEPVAEEPFPQLAPVIADEDVQTPHAEEASAAPRAEEAAGEPAAGEGAPPAADPPQPVRSRRSTRSGSGSGRRTRRTTAGTASGTASSGDSAAGADSASGAASEPADEASRAPRRRRTRRPAAAVAATDSSGTDSSTVDSSTADPEPTRSEAGA